MFHTILNASVVGIPNTSSTTGCISLVTTPVDSSFINTYSYLGTE
nr:MAG TPA: hypothetical protein [Caudoviricetes sp.]